MPRLLSLLALLSVLVVPPARGANLPSGLGEADVARVVEVVGLAGSTRLLRSAEAYPSFPGIKFGFEVLLVPTKNLNSLGDGTGTLPGLLPVPRLFVAKGLFMDLDLIFNFFPASDINRISTLGLALKYTFFQERDSWVSSALYLAYTKLSGFDDRYSGNDFELGMVMSKDFVRIKPFVSLGALLASGEIDASLAATPNRSSTFTTLHISLGAEVEMPISFSAQLDLWNLSLGASLFVGKKF